MTDKDDFELLTDYVARGAEGAFTALTKRYVHLVYSAAVRQVRDPHLAEDVTQAVFIILSKKAHLLRRETILSGWLLRTTRFTATNVLVSQYRRIRREQGAAEMQNTVADESAWEQMAPLLDEALAKLREQDRNALALRFFQQKPLKEVGVALGIDADTARKRVARAVDKLRRIFIKQGVPLSALAIAGALSANAVQAAPAAVVSAVAAAGILKGTAAASTSTATLIKATLKLMAWTKVKTTIVATAAILLTTGTAMIVTMSVTGFFGQTVPGSKLRLPVGTGTPAIALGSWHGIILASDGSLWSWGEDHLGWHALGLDNIQTQPCLRRIGNGTDWISLAVGAAHNLAIKSDGTLWGWGQNLYGQLGDGSSARWQSTPVPSVPGKDWKQAAVGRGGHSVALKKDGTLWAWGNNWAGQLGIGRTNRVVREAMQIGSATNWVRIWAGTIQTVGMQADGRLWFWGVNPNPAIPESRTGASNIFVPTLLSSDTNWMDVGFGYSVAFAIKSDGTLWAWGRQAHIYTDPHDETLDTTPVRVGTNTDWQAGSFSGAFYHVLRKKDGSLWSLDASEHRVRKPASSYRPLEFRRIDLHKDLVAFGAMGDSTGVALTRDGEVWTWGVALGEYTPVSQALASLSRWVHLSKEPRLENVMRAKPWQLPNVDPSDPSIK